jgi:hypothetical protein
MSSLILHIGYSKAGSTFLKNWFTKHPGIQLGGFKNYESLSDYVEKSGDEDLKQQLVLSNHVFNLFKWNFEDPLDVWMRKPDLPVYQGKMCGVLSNFFPKAKILFVTRGFKSMLKSFYSEYIRTGGLLSFNDMLEEHGSYFLKSTYNYDYLVNLYIEKFGRENVIVLPYELLKENSEKFLRVLEESFGLNYYDFSCNPVNLTIGPKQMYWNRRLSNIVFKISRLFGLKTGNKCFKLYMRHTLLGNLNLLINVLTKWSKQEEKLEITSQGLNYFKGKAQVLIGFPHYKEYYTDYLIDN